MVEAQHVVSTRSLVDTRDEQEMLESLLERSKPDYPQIEGLKGLHYLLATPFRYPPLRHGSRFGTTTEPSIWYGSTRPRAAFAETAYYRLYFLEGTDADLGPVSVELSLFNVPLRTRKGIDLNREPFDACRDEIASKTDYRKTQRLGADMRAASVEAFRYPSARDTRGGVNWGVFSPKAFAEPTPSQPETWHGVASKERVEFTKKDFFSSRTLEFPRENFLVDGKLPSPAP